MVDSVVLTTDMLVEAVIDTGMFPDQRETLTKDKIISILNREMQIYALPRLLSVKEEYLVYTPDPATPLVARVTRYPIPYRAVGNKLRNIHYKNSNNQWFKMTQLHPEDRSKNSYYDYSAGLNYEFYVEGTDIVLSSQIADTGGFLAMSYYLRPNMLVTDTRGGVITIVDNTTVPGNTTLTMSNFPVHFSATALFDFVGAQSPNKIKKFDIPIISQNLNAKTVTFLTTNIPSDLIVGDYVMAAGESIVPQLPTEMVPLLMQKAVVKCLESLNDTEGLANARADLKDMEENVYKLIDSRIEGNPKKVLNSNTFLGATKLRYSSRWRY